MELLDQDGKSLILNGVSPELQNNLVQKMQVPEHINFKTTQTPLIAMLEKGAYFSPLRHNKLTADTLAYSLKQEEIDANSSSGELLKAAKHIINEVKQRKAQATHTRPAPDKVLIDMSNIKVIPGKVLGELLVELYTGLKNSGVTLHVTGIQEYLYEGVKTKNLGRIMDVSTQSVEEWINRQKSQSLQ